MNDTKYIGMDVHRESISIAVLNSAGKIVLEAILETKAETIPQFIHGLRGSLHVTFEEGMPEHIFQSDTDASIASTNWGAIWAGTFTFIAIWSVLGLLGEAIFASAATPNAGNPIMGMSVGIGFWVAILTIIAMFVAGRITGQLAGVLEKTSAIMHGMVMFGLSVSAALVIIVLGTLGLGTFATIVGGAQSAHVLGVFADAGWIGFVSLLLGWLAAIGRASSAVQHRAAEHPAQQARRAAA